MLRKSRGTKRNNRPCRGAAIIIMRRMNSRNMMKNRNTMKNRNKKNNSRKSTKKAKKNKGRK